MCTHWTTLIMWMGWHIRFEHCFRCTHVHSYKITSTEETHARFFTKPAQGKPNQSVFVYAVYIYKNYSNHSRHYRSSTFIRLYIYIPFHSIPYIHKWKKAAENLIAIVRLAIAYGLMDMSDEKQLPITMFIYATGNWAAAIFSSSCLFNCTFYFGTYNQRNLFAHNKHSYPFMIDVFCALVCCFFHSLYILYCDCCCVAWANRAAKK